MTALALRASAQPTVAHEAFFAWSFPVEIDAPSALLPGARALVARLERLEQPVKPGYAYVQPGAVGNASSGTTRLRAVVRASSATGAPVPAFFSAQ